MNTCTTISPKIASDSKSYTSELTALSSLHHSLSLSDPKDAWKHFITMQSSKENSPSRNEILQKLAATGGDLANAFPQLSIAFKIILWEQHLWNVVTVQWHEFATE